MAYSNIDRTSEVNMGKAELSVKSTDYCHYFIRHPDTFLQRKECWTCKYSDFGIETGITTDSGICRCKQNKMK
jgi:hypothetical protein